MQRLREAASGVDLKMPQVPVVAHPKEVDLWQIVVTGTIDPRQFGPLWFQLIGCINEQEFLAAQRSLVVVGIPPQGQSPLPMGAIPPINLCQFDVGPFAVIVTADRWTIQTASEDQRGRILDVTVVVFRKLNEIYVNAFGVNRLFGVSTSTSTAKEFLASKVAAADFGLPEGNAESQISYTQHRPDFDTMIQLTASPLDPRRVNILYNRHHPIKTPAQGYFDVGEMLIDVAESDWNSALEYRTRLGESIARAERK